MRHRSSYFNLDNPNAGLINFLGFFGADILGPGNVQQVKAGTIADGVTILGGLQRVLDQGIAKNTIVKTGNTDQNLQTLTTGQDVFMGGLADNTTISGGIQVIEKGGNATNTIANGGNLKTSLQYVYGVSQDTTLYGFYNNKQPDFLGSGQIVGNGGVANGTIVNGLGYTPVNKQPFQTVLSGGVATNTIDRGVMTVNSGGKAINPTIYGVATVDTGGIVQDAHLAGGGLYLFGTASGTLFFDGPATAASSSTLVVGNYQPLTGYNNFSASIGNIGNGGTIDLTQLKFNADNHAAFLNGNVLTVTNGSATEAFTLTGNYAATFTVTNDGTGGSLVKATPTTIGNNFIGFLAADTLGPGQLQEVKAGTTADGVTIAGGLQKILDQGAAKNTTVNSGSIDPNLKTLTTGQDVLAGGLADHSTLNAGGIQVIEKGGNATATTVNGGSNLHQSVQYVYGVSHDTTVTSDWNIKQPGLLGAKQIVADGGVAVGTTISYGGGNHYPEQDVLSGGVAANTVDYGKMYVASGGKAILPTIVGNAWIDIGGTIQDAHISGGNLYLDGSASGTIFFDKATGPFAGAHNSQLIIGSSIFSQPITGNNSFGASIGNFGNGGAIDLAKLAFNADNHAVFLNGNILTVTNGAASESFMLTGNYAAKFTITNDGAGGSLVTALPLAQSVIQTTGMSENTQSLVDS